MNALKISWCTLMGVVSLALVPIQGAELKPAELEFFEKEVRPLLAAKCLQCHASDSKQQGGLVLDTKAGWEMGGESGPAIVPGKPEESLLVEAVRYDSFEMPPKKQMTKDEIDILVRWVKMGAPDPRTEGGPTAPQGIDVEKGRAYWAFQHPQKTAQPAVKHSAWPINEIDRFILAKQEAQGILPVADADRLSLIRRVTFDLTGLPPTRQEVEAFVSDPTSDTEALEKVVDRLLSSQHFGERWGRYWLDVARYGDSQANVPLRYAWQYRNYVIDAFNADKPFDQFIREQIAGDLLPAKDDHTRDQQTIATGFLALGDRNTGQIDEVVDEQIDVTTKAFMAITVTCARCHDHKFDPIPTEDYYAMAGIFRSTQVQRSARTGSRNRLPRLLTNADAKKQEQFEQKLETFRTGIVRKMDTAQRDRDRAQREMTLLQNRYHGKSQSQPAFKKAEAKLKQVDARFQKIKKEYGAALSELEQLQQPVACGVADAKKPNDQRLYIRGDRLNQGDSIPRGFVQVISDKGRHSIQDKQQSGRLELARWIADANNPLTGRTIVNRVWQQLFGHGIVPTVDNFGSLGERPSHPELLDYLAVQFTEDGWSLKRLIKQIVTSRTYRLSTIGNAKNLERDGDNRLLWRMNRRRLDAESIRDAILAFSGRLELDSLLAGQLAELTYQRPDFTVPCRSVYLPVMRTNGYDFFETFDGADSTIVVGRRPVSTVPTQVLYLLNSPLAMEESQHAAKRLFEEELNDEERIQQVYWNAFSRAPREDERAWILDFITNYPELMKAEGKSSKAPQLEAWTRVCQALIASAEFQVLN